MTICLLDTSILVEILNVPFHNTHHPEIYAELKQKLAGGESLFLPMAAILETGNHIAQNGDGTAKRKIAKEFVKLVRQSIKGQTPFAPIFMDTFGDIDSWVDAFPDSATRSESLGDLSIIMDWNKICAVNPRARVYIWSLDRHLAAYDRSPS